MKRQSETNTDRWAGRRKVFFVENKRIADKLAKQRGGMCLSGPQRKSEKWLWKCKDPTHKPWKAKLFQVEGFGGRKGSWCPLCRSSSWAKRRNKLFAENKKLADKLAKQKGGRCLSGPRRKHDKWRWKCDNNEHKVWQATLCQIEGSGKKTRIMVPALFGEKRPKERASGMGEAVWWKARKAGLKHRENVYLVVQVSRQFLQDIQ